MKLKLASLLFAAFAAFVLPTERAQAQQFWLGEIVVGGWNFCPRTTLPADGQLLPISQWSALFSLYGCNYGGDCRTTFALPDLRGRIAMHHGTGPGLAPVQLAQRGGRNDVTLNQLNLPSHSHAITNTVTATENVGGGPAGNFDPGDHFTANANIYGSAGAPTQPLADGSVDVTVTSTAANTGGSQSFNIANPYLGLQFCVVTQGTFPSRS